MQMFSGMRISASGLTAERRRMDVISTNIANANTNAQAGKPVYQALRLQTSPADLSPFGEFLAGFKEFPEAGVKVTGIAAEKGQPRLLYQPGHPDADVNGYVAYPDINILDEMVDAISASRTYEANLTAFNETKKMFNKALEIGK